MISLLIGFEETLQQWKTWDNVTVIQNHQAIKDHLCDLFRRGLDVQVRFCCRSVVKVFTTSAYYSQTLLYTVKTPSES